MPDERALMELLGRPAPATQDAGSLRLVLRGCLESRRRVNDALHEAVSNGGDERWDRYKGIMEAEYGETGWACLRADMAYRTLLDEAGAGVPDATHCLEYVRVDGEPRLRNACDFEISIAYCSTSRSISEGGCGYDGRRYFTDFTRLGPSRSPVDSTGVAWADDGEPDLEAEACRAIESGHESFDPDGWDGEGGFRCWPYE